MSGCLEGTWHTLLYVWDFLCFYSMEQLLPRVSHKPKWGQGQCWEGHGAVSPLLCLRPFWLLRDAKPCPCLFLFLPHLDRLIRKPTCSLSWWLLNAQSTQATSYPGILRPAPPLTTINAKVSLPFLLCLGPFSDLLVSLPCSPRKTSSCEK